MNAAVRAVVRTAAFYDMECVAIYRGYQGLIDDITKEMNPRSVNNIINKGGTVLKSARCLEFRTPEGRKKHLVLFKNTELMPWLSSVVTVLLQEL